MKDTKKFIKRWSKSRKKGKLKYVLTFSIIMGLVMFVSSMFGRLIANGFSIFSMEYYWDMPLASFIGGFIGGVFGSKIRWNKNEEKYNVLINRKDFS